MDDHLSTRQVGWILGRSQGTVRDLIRDGEIAGIRLIDEVITTNEQLRYEVGEENVMQPATEAMSRAGKGTAARSEAGNSHPVPWEEARARLPKGGWSWLATVRPDGRPHVMPILAAWSGPALFFCSKDSARKSRNLADNDHCVIAFEADDLHLIVEGHARRVGDEATLQRVSEAFKTIYHWDTVVAGDKLDSDVGAPTSGGPPFDVFEVTPTKAFGLPVDGESVTPTRWRF